MTIYSPVQNSNIKLKQDLPDPLCYLYADEYFYGLVGNVAEEAFKAGDWVNKINNNGINSFNNFCTNKKIIKILAIGDSWFHYPGFGKDGHLLHGGDGNFLDCLRDRRTVGIYRVGLNGAEAKDLFDEEHRNFYDGLLKKGNFDLVLISLGGNDLAAENVAKYIKNKDIDTKSLENIYQEILEKYEWFLTLLSDYKIPVLGHCYDDATYDNGGANLEMDFLGIDLSNIIHSKKNWIVRHLEHEGIKDKHKQADIVNTVLEGFKKNVLDKLRLQEQFNFSYVDTYDCLSKYAQGQLPRIPSIPVTQDQTPKRFWLNEIHPTRDGFRILENYLYDAIAKTLNLPDLGITNLNSVSSALVTAG
ncbi:MAG: SGNH/GDSL hydrolase family protein [Candidatus Melainabacteria bacterium]